MRSSLTSTVVLVGLTVGFASLYGCTLGDEAEGDGSPFTNPTGGTSGSGTAGSGTSGSGTGIAGTPGSGGSGTSGSGPTAGSSGAAGSAPTAGSAGSGAGGGEITKVWKSNGCGKAFAGQSGAKVTIQTMGVKPNMCPSDDPTKCCANKLDGKSVCGPYTVNRDYYVYMPANYDMNKAYPLVIEGPGCGGAGSNVYPLPDIANQSIRIGITPPPNSIGHGTNENQGCFDDKEGDDSVDWVFYENFYDKLNADVCFDRNRVFSAGNSSGSWFSNELGCKYAGDAMRPVRGVMPNTGGLPNEAKFVPTCTNKPMTGIWVHEVNESINYFAGNKVAIDRAIKVNGCTGAMSYDAKVAANEIQDFPIGGNNPPATCKLLKGCPEIHPLVVCALPGNEHDGHDSVANPAFATFVKQFSVGNFLTQ